MSKFKKSFKHPFFSQLWVALTIYVLGQLVSIISGIKWNDDVYLYINRPLWQIVIIAFVILIIIRVVVRMMKPKQIQNTRILHDGLSDLEYLEKYIKFKGDEYFKDFEKICYNETNNEDGDIDEWISNDIIEYFKVKGLLTINNSYTTVYSPKGIIFRAFKSIEKMKGIRPEDDIQAFLKEMQV